MQQSLHKYKFIFLYFYFHFWFADPPVYFSTNSIPSNTFIVVSYFVTLEN